MKKVISALTAAVMCASMSVSVMPAIAAYTASDIDFYLGAVSAGKGTISADGSTITFASAADAAGAEILVNSYFHVADTSDPSVAGFNLAVSPSSKSISLPMEKATGFKDAGAETKEYTLSDGRTFSTNTFVSTFDYLNKLGKYKSGTGTGTWGHSSGWYWADEYTGPEILNLMWQPSFDDKSRDNYGDTAAFIDTDSTAFPAAQFTAVLASDIADGTYTIDYADWQHKDYGAQPGASVTIKAGQTEKITQTKGLKIVVGDGAQTDETTTETTKATEVTTTETTQAPTQESTTEAPATQTTSEVVTPGNDNKVNGDQWTWYVEDVTWDPAKEKYATIAVHVANDPGMYGFRANLLVDGKPMAQAFGSEDAILDEGLDGSYSTMTYVSNPNTGEYGAAEGGKKENNKADGDEVVWYFAVAPEDTTPGKVYTITFDSLLVNNIDSETFVPPTVAAVGGTLTIAGGTGTTTEATTTEQTTTEQPTTEVTTTETETTAPTAGPEGYLYGDVNENGKVELVDIVMLNRFLTKYADQSLTAVATVNANCYRAAKESDADTTVANLDGQDSMEILKYLIGSVGTLPTQAK